jgi:hypothetical protein
VASIDSGTTGSAAGMGRGPTPVLVPTGGPTGGLVGAAAAGVLYVGPTGPLDRPTTTSTGSAQGPPGTATPVPSPTTAAVGVGVGGLVWVAALNQHVGA